MIKNCKITTSQIILFFGLALFELTLAGTSSNRLDAISNFYLNKMPFELKFSIRNIDNQGNTLSQMQGGFILKNKANFKVEYPQEELLFDGKWLWTYNKATEQIVVEEFEPTSSLNLIYDVINGKLNNYKIEKSQTIDNHHKIFLQPQDDNNFFQEIQLTADQDTNKIEYLKYVDFQDNQIVIDFLDIKKTTVCDSVFYKVRNVNNKELIDLRP